MRVSDRDRQAAADRLRVAHDEGRLDFAEYDERLASAYRAVRFADLEPLFADLPAGTGAVAPVRPPAPPGRTTALVARPAVRQMPLALKILWIVWTSVVAINLTVWLLVGLTSGVATVYFWPMWLAVPGSALVITSAAIMAARRNSPGPSPGPRQ